MTEVDAAIRTGRFAPYPVWLGLRIVTALAGAITVFWLAHAMYALVQAVDGKGVDLLPPWVFVVAVIAGAQPRHWRGNLPPFGELIGNVLASKQCPACGQSIFDHTPPYGYAEEVEKKRFMPSRHCANCGHDMALREAVPGENA